MVCTVLIDDTNPGRVVRALARVLVGSRSDDGGLGRREKGRGLLVSQSSTLGGVRAWVGRKTCFNDPRLRLVGEKKGIKPGFLQGWGNSGYEKASASKRGTAGIWLAAGVVC